MANKKQRRKKVMALPDGLTCCPNCGIYFCPHLSRSDRMYCGPSCNVSSAQKRARAKEVGLEPLPPRLPTTTGDKLV